VVDSQQWIRARRKFSDGNETVMVGEMELAKTGKWV
jgi:hypothetical protein